MQEMYNNIESTDDGDVVMLRVVEYIQAVEAGMGKNLWVNRRMVDLVEESREREVVHVEFEEFCEIIKDIVEAGWSLRKASQNERISNTDIRHVFEKVDRDNNGLVDRQVMSLHSAD
jgi:Ca2+-binding EF-hand superfamily protein